MPDRKAAKKARRHQKRKAHVKAAATPGYQSPTAWKRRQQRILNERNNAFERIMPLLYSR